MNHAGALYVRVQANWQLVITTNIFTSVVNLEGDQKMEDYNTITDTTDILPMAK